MIEHKCKGKLCQGESVEKAMYCKAWMAMVLKGQKVCFSVMNENFDLLFAFYFFFLFFLFNFSLLASFHKTPVGSQRCLAA